MGELDLDAVLARHGHDEHMGMCSLCMFEWPCDAMRLVDEVRRLRARMLAQDAVLDELRTSVRRLRAIEDMARFVLAEHDIANTRPKADGNALGHAHRNPPRWDDRDGTCTWCVSVAALRHALGADRD